MVSENRLKSRFILNSDPKVNEFIYPLPETWWSRPYEYAWCASFLESEDTAMDAACGIPHPFKFALGRTCKEAHACDWDARIISHESVLEAVRSEINEAAAEQVRKGKYTETQLKQASLTQLPYPDSFFDKIYCISVFEHLSPNDMQLTMQEFKRTLKDEGIIILTLDVPTIDLDMFQDLLHRSALEPLSEVDYVLPQDALRTDLWGGLFCFRAALKKKG